MVLVNSISYTDFKYINRLLKHLRNLSLLIDYVSKNLKRAFLFNMRIYLFSTNPLILREFA